MAGLKDTAATSALNEEQYINKLYDARGEKQQGVLGQNYRENTGVLDEEKQNVQNQTTENLQRTNVEADKMASSYQGANAPRISAGAADQAGLSQWNQRAADTTALQNRQKAADAEIERQRQILGSQYAAAIQQAQAENDMQRAQQLYDAAKNEEAQLLELRKQAAQLMAGKGDTSILDALANGEMPKADTQGETWAEVLKNEAAINGIYDNQAAAENARMLAEYQKKLSDLEAQRQQQAENTDRSLTQAYVDALQRQKGYADSQVAYGQGSGVNAQARLSQNLGLQQRLTDLRGVQMGADAAAGMNGYAAGQEYRSAMADANAERELARVKALYGAAENEEKTLVDTQKFLGEQYAKKGDYSILGKLYGLTQDQIDRLNGVGRYAARRSGSGGGGGTGGGENYILTPEELVYYNKIRAGKRKGKTPSAT